MGWLGGGGVSMHLLRGSNTIEGIIKFNVTYKLPSLH